MTTKKDRDAVFAPHSREDLKYWVKTNRKTTLRVFDLIEAIMRDPFEGIGKPEALKYLGPGIWSRRITKARSPGLHRRRKADHLFASTLSLQ